MDYTVLKNELNNDPLGIGYAGMTSSEASVSINTANQSRNRASMTGDEVFSATDSTEFGSLSDTNKTLWLSFCGRDSINPFGLANVAFVTYLFNNPSTTLSSLQGLRTETVSRAVVLGLRYVTPGDIEYARTL